MNDYFTSHPILDLDSLKTRSLPQDFLVLNYAGVLSPNLSVGGASSRSGTSRSRTTARSTRTS